MKQRSPLFFANPDGISIDCFFSEYWQKKSLFVKQALEDCEDIIDAETLAGLSLEREVVSRLVLENKQTNTWSLEHGPFDESRFANLPDKDWSLLVQHVDALLPEVNELLNSFRFIPNWRLDDIMISYAPDGGGVGPHFDYYDVFLLQLSGQRRWKIGQQCDSTSQLIPDQPMKILNTFETQQAWEANPGDLIYIPAGTAHWGEAIGESITCSIGFRAPSHADILFDIAHEAASKTEEHHRYSDPKFSHALHCGEIPDKTINELQNIITDHINNKDTIAKWFGEYSTQIHYYPLADDETVASFDDLYADDSKKEITLSKYCRAAYIKTEDSALLFINGQSFSCSEKLAQLLSSYSSFSVKLLSEHEVTMIKQLVQKGLIVQS